MMSAGRDLSTDAIAADAARLQAAYAKREDQTSWASAAKVFTLQERERYALKVLNRYGFLPLAEKAILDIGCGSGGWIQQLIRWGAHADHITGIDLLGDRIGQARQRVPAACRDSSSTRQRAGAGRVAYSVRSVRV